MPSAAPTRDEQDAGERDEEADDPEPELADDVLTPGLLEQVLGALERVADADVLEHEDRHGEEGDEVPGETDERATIVPTMPDAPRSPDDHA